MTAVLKFLPIDEQNSFFSLIKNSFQSLDYDVPESTLMKKEEKSKNAEVTSEFFCFDFAVTR